MTDRRDLLDRLHAAAQRSLQRDQEPEQLTLIEETETWDDWIRSLPQPERPAWLDEIVQPQREEPT